MFEFLRDKDSEKGTEFQKEKEIINEIISTKEELNTASMNYEYAEDEMIDYYVYKIKSHQAKLNFLVKTAKIKGIEVDMINQIKIRNDINEKVV